MDELRKNNTLELQFKNNITLTGIVVDFTSNRIDVLVLNDSIQKAKNIVPLEDLTIIAYTDYGIKKTYSSVINAINGKNIMSVENNPSIPVVQKREFVRISSDLNFKIKKNDEIFDCECLNISGGGVAFKTLEGKFVKGEKVQIVFLSSDFEKNIFIDAIIHSVSPKKTVAKYLEINQNDEAKIVKYVFKKSAKRILK